MSGAEINKLAGQIRISLSWRRNGADRMAPQIKRGERRGMSWTAERETRMRELWSLGMSASQVAAELGCTKNAVIGKVHRLGIGKRAKSPTPKIAPRPRPTVVSRPPPPPTPLAPEDEYIVIPESARVTLVELEYHHCRWPIGDPRNEDFRFCGARKCEPYSEFNSYCEQHAAIAFYRKPGSKPRVVSDATRAKKRAAHVKRGSTAWRQG